MNGYNIMVQWTKILIAQTFRIPSRLLYVKTLVYQIMPLLILMSSLLKKTLIIWFTKHFFETVNIELVIANVPLIFVKISMGTMDEVYINNFDLLFSSIPSGTVNCFISNYFY